MPIWSLILALALGGCTAARSAPTSGPKQPDSAVSAPSQPGPGPVAEGAAWQKLLDGRWRLYYAAPGGSSLLFRESRAGNRVVAVTPGDPPAVKDVAVRQVGGASVLSTPDGFIPAPLQSDQSTALSPDGRRAAVTAQDGVHLVDLQSGESRRLTSDAEPAPPNLSKYVYWSWAGAPRWSADGRWVYFETSRLDPRRPSLWRVPAEGGAEEYAGPAPFVLYPGQRDSLVRPVSSQFLRWFADDDRVKHWPQTLPFHLPLSPDGRRAAAYDPTTRTVRVIDVDRPDSPAASVQLPEGFALGRDEDFEQVAWSPDGNRLLLYVRPPGHNSPSFAAVLDVAGGGRVAYYPPADPGAGLLTPLGWADAHRIVVRLAPWTPNGPEPLDAKQQIWLLDLDRASPPAPGQPAKVISARLFGDGVDFGGVPAGGSIAITGRGDLVIRLDKAVDAAWIAHSVTVEGSGATVQTGGGPLGVVLVTVPKVPPGEQVRVRIPGLSYELTIRQSTPQAITVDLRQDGGPWQAVDPDRSWPARPTDVRVRFAKPLDPAVGEALAKQALQTKEGVRPEGASAAWEGGALLLHIPAPPPLLAVHLDNVADPDGLMSGSLSLPELRFGPPPTLVTGSLVREVPVNITKAELAADGSSALLERFHLGAGPYAGARVRSVVHLQTGELRDLPAPGRDDSGLVWVRTSGSRQAGVEQKRWLGRAGDYRYEGDLVIREGDREVQRIPGLRSFWPFEASIYFSAGDLAWAPDGHRLAVTLSDGPAGFSLWLADTTDGTLRKVAGGLAGYEVAWSPDGRYAAAGRQVVDVASGRVVVRLGGSQFLRWSPTGDQILYAVEEWGRMEAMNVATGEARDLGRGMPVGWTEKGEPVFIRWQNSDSRYWEYAE